MSRVVFATPSCKQSGLLQIHSVTDHVHQEFATLPKPTTDNQDPLYRLFYREGIIGAGLLKQVRRDLGDVSKVCEGTLKQTNHLRTLISSLTKGTAHLLVSPC
jgi:hypothetical protein